MTSNPTSSPRIFAVLTVYRRPQTLLRQLAALAEQTLPPTEVAVWENGPWPAAVPHGTRRNRLPGNFVLRHVGTGDNQGVWPRFEQVPETPCDLMLVLDDDTIPGPRWLEACAAAYQQRPGCYAAAGFRFPVPNILSKVCYGWPEATPTLTQIDWPGHSWLFDMQVAEAFRARRSDMRASLTAGEDMHLAYVVQQLGQGCWSMPHPAADISCWGSTDGRRLGSDAVAVHRQRGQQARFVRAFNYYRWLGWQFLSEMSSAKPDDRVEHLSPVAPV